MNDAVAFLDALLGGITLTAFAGALES